ncbi:MAG: PEP-CTERM/exosortase system-associated acyltransferase [Burkholderiales bacterium]
MSDSASQDSPDTGDSFDKYFEIVPALTPDLKNIVFGIRHQVFCEDLGFEEVRPDGRENDKYDSQSLHLLIRNVQNGGYVGCTRIVRARLQDAQPHMPFETYCAEVINRSIIDPGALPRDCVGEISRLSVIAAYRKRQGEPLKPATISSGDFGTQARPRFPYLTVGLYFGTVELARRHGITTLFALTEPRLTEHFRKLGMNIQTIGGPVEHRGLRIPSMMTTGTFVDDLRAMFRPMYETIAREVAAAFIGPQPPAGSAT